MRLGISQDFEQFSLRGEHGTLETMGYTLKLPRGEGLALKPKKNSVRLTPRLSSGNTGTVKKGCCGRGLSGGPKRLIPPK